MQRACISIEKVRRRVDSAKQDAIKLFINPKSKTDFYLEDLLNCFIGLAQYPLNFAFFSKRNGKLELLFHLCSDKEHEARFEKKISEDCGIKMETTEPRLFQVFPTILSSQFSVAIYHMHTKAEGGMQIIAPEEKPFVDLEGDQAVDTFDRYISLCAHYFFEEKWDVAGSDFAVGMRRYIETSLDSIGGNHRSWLEKQYTTFKALDEIGYPNDIKDDWKRKLEDVFESTIENNMNRVGIVGDLFYCGDGSAQNKDKPLTNMLLAIRAFSREVSTAPTGEVIGLRHEIKKGIGYAYDTTFLLPRSAIDAVAHSLGELRDKFLEYREMTKSDSSMTMEAFFLNYGIRLYREAFIDERSEISQTLLTSLDTDFWDALAEKDGVKSCINCLQSWVGDKARSLVDPVYHTSLIHTNMLFEHAGLDRVGDIVEGRTTSFLEIDEDQRNDVRRIVILYYLMGSMISWKGSEHADFSRRLAAILVPVCMRGSVWGVTIHATYIEDYDTKFADEQYWQAYFKTATDLRQKQSMEFDKCLWDQALHRVERLLEKSIAKAGDVESQGDAVVAGIKQANLKMQEETRVSPFAFPALHIPSEAGAPPSCKVTFSYSGDEKFDISWEVLDNRFFLARQPWNLTGTRNFRSSMEVGHRRGFNEMAYRAGMRRKEVEYLELLLRDRLEENERPN